MMLSRDLRAEAAVRLWIMFLLLEDLLGACAVGDYKRRVPSAPNTDIRNTLEKPRVTTQEVAGPHTLRYDLMALSLKLPELPQVLIWRYFDEEPFLHYNESSNRTDSWEPRIKRHWRAMAWARETEDLQEMVEQLERMLAEVTGQKGQDKGLHILQATLGCELQRNGSTRGFWHLGYDGRNLLTFDQRTLTWTMDVPFTQQKTFWEPRAPRADLVKTFLDDTCPAQLQRHLASLRSEPLDTGSPMVIVTFRNYPLGRVTLTCRAFNLYPHVATRGTLAWLQDRKLVKQKAFEPGTVLPSGDRTYQIWVSIWVLPGQEPQFTCNLSYHGGNIEKRAVTVNNVSGEKTRQPSILGAGGRVKKSLCTTMTTAFMVTSWTRKTGGDSTLLLLWWLLFFSTALAVLTLV
ncbi:hereditary hemochromatosis protein homolog [Rattus rattus]|uniref:hereditary hemochromatosis protein homolog n=1 Tax=Rattus rattus TaxID=10117 RepID=UPI0013F2F92B|nr:hereditary hemochromatosis protein homolog [Rattus rattus]